MKTIALGSFFVLFAIAVGMTTGSAFADHATATVSTPAGTSVPGCEETNECYIPYEVTVDVGGEVTWTNDDTAAHTVTGGSAADGPSGVFDSSLFMAGTSFTHKFEAVGEYPYFCMVHPWMEGIVIVQEAGAMEDDTMKDDDKMQMDDPVMMDEGASVTTMMSDGTMVSIWASEPAEDEIMEITIEFKDMEHVNYGIMVTQNDEEVFNGDTHEHGGKGVHMTAPLSSSDPVDITVTLNGYGLPGEEDNWTGPLGEEVVFSNVVPEFGTIAMMVLAVAIISIVAVTAKTRVVPRL